MTQPVKCATPADTGTVRPPGLAQVSAASPGLRPIARVTLSVLSLATTVPKPSWIATETANVPLTGILAPAPGCAVKASFGVPVLGTCRDTPAAVFQPPLARAPELVT